MDAIRRLLLLLLLGLMPGAAARCELELGQLAAGLPEQLGEGVLAAQLLYGAVELVEPVLPPWRHNAVVPLEPDEAGYRAVEFLLERDLLPDGWESDRLSPDLWAEMLERFLSWYQLDWTGGSAGPPSREQLIADLSSALAQVAEAVRPVAVIAHEDAEAVVFVGIIWNWTSYPRLLVKRVPEGITVADGVEEVLPLLGTCAVEVEHYALAPVATAWRLFVGTGESTMYLLESEPPRPDWPLAVEQDEVRPYLEFATAEVRGSLQFSAAFAGQELGLGAILSLLTQVRSNIPPLSIGRYLDVP